MKRIIILLLTIPVIGFSQKQPLVPYLSLSTSIGSFKDFNQSSYPSMEVGLSKNNYSYGVIYGRSSFEKNSPSFYELKTSYSFMISKLQSYILLGGGSYFDSNYFYEYGFGFNFNLNKSFSVFTQLSNWDRSNYLSFGITKIFLK